MNRQLRKSQDSFKSARRAMSQDVVGIEAPFRWTAIKRRLEEAAARAVESARAAYTFNSGHYTAKALADVVAIQTLLGWLNDLGKPK
jgi:hypothetical protein